MLEYPNLANSAKRLFSNLSNVFSTSLVRAKIICGRSFFEKCVIYFRYIVWSSLTSLSLNGKVLDRHQSLSFFRKGSAHGVGGGRGSLRNSWKRPTRGNSKKGENPRHSKGKIFLQRGKTNKQDETKQNIQVGYPKKIPVSTEKTGTGSRVKCSNTRYIDYRSSWNSGTRMTNWVQWK